MSDYTHHCDGCGAWYCWDSDQWISADVLRGWDYERSDIPHDVMTCPECALICAACGRVSEELVKDGETWGGVVWAVCKQCVEEPWNQQLSSTGR